MMITNEERVRGEILCGERFFVERSALWRDFLRRDSLYGENSQGEIIFPERISLWRDSPRREELRGEPGLFSLLNYCQVLVIFKIT
jgi:hypothetical protein